MIKAFVLYPNNPNTVFDLDYYCNKHVPMVAALLGDALLGATVDAGLAGGEPGQAAPYAMISSLSFESMESFQAGFAPHATAIQADVANFSNTAPVIQISESKL